MKKLMMTLICASLVFAVVGCKKKTTEEKAVDAATEIQKDAAKEAEAAKAEAAKKLDALKKK